LCGKHSAISSFTPDEYYEEISIIPYRGLGRGKGFKSILVSTIEDYPELSEKLRIGVSRIQHLLDNEKPRNMADRESSIREELEEIFVDLETEQTKRKVLETKVHRYEDRLRDVSSKNREYENKINQQIDTIEELDEENIHLEREHKQLQEYPENIL